MADLKFSTPTAAMVVPTAGAKTMLLLKAPANQRVKVLQYEWYPDNNAALLTVDLFYTDGNADGTAAGTVTSAKDDPDLGETIQSVAKYGPYTVEPSNITVVKTIKMVGAVCETFPVDAIKKCGGAKHWGLRMVASQAVYATASLGCEE